MPGNETVLIDLDAIVKSRFGAKKVPQFLLNWLKKFIHQDHLNGFLRKGYLGVEFAEQSLVYYDASITVEGLDEIPVDGRYTFAGNHPLGGIDALSVIAKVGRRFDGNIVVPANDFLMAIKPIAEYTIPVNKMGGQSSALVGLINEAFNSDRQVIIFPAGLCSRKIDGIVQDLPWKKTFITKSVETGRWIVPVHFIGTNSKRFYRVDSLCKRLGIKFNVPMMFLPDELYKAHGKEYEIVFGKPIPPSRFDSSKSPLQWAAVLRDEVYKLK